jgi:hypothetical protein
MVTSGLGRTKYTKFLWPSDKQGVEDFQNEFAKAHCAVEAKHFLPCHQGKVDFRKRARSGATIKQTTNNDQTKLQRLVELM